MTNNKKPNKYVSIHNHTCFSAADGLGYPDDHFKWCISNGLDAHAITDHGNMNGYAHAQLWVEEYNKTAEKKFKYIPGVEGYFHPDLKQWAKDKELHELSKTDKKTKHKLQDQEEVQTKLSIKTDENEDIEEIETTNQLVLEDEDATKTNKHFNPVNRRHHLVVIPKNDKGLLEVFSLVSRSFLKGFYRFPRFDASDLKELCNNGNVITSSACIGSMIGWSIFKILQGIEFDELHASLLDDKNMLDKCVNAVGEYFQLMEDSIGKGNNYLELQFNKLPAQNLVNRAILEFVKRNGIEDKLIVTCDAHYYNPDVWKERELYKKLGFMNYKDIGPESLPKSKSDLKCELYPKNAVQIWEEYQRVRKGEEWYEDDVVCDAIERSYDVAHEVLEWVKPDRSAKYPKKLLVPEDTTSFKHLVKLCKEGLIKRGLDQKQEYVDRLKYELSVIKQLDNADYFITYQKIIELAKTVGLVGPGRGSGCGSLMNYVLYITDLDPIQWKLPYERFISIYRKGSPDIDCINSKHLVVMFDKSYKIISDVKIGDYILGCDHKAHKVLQTYIRPLRNLESSLSFLVKTYDNVLGHINVVPKHKFILNNQQIIQAADVKIGDLLFTNSQLTCEVLKIELSTLNDLYVDITVEDDHRFFLIPFDVIITQTNTTILTTQYEI